MTVIKICGVTRVEDALAIASMDIDIIGLVFAESKRRISLETATEISIQLRRLKKRPALAGVFVNENLRMVNTIAYTCGLDIVQFSGDEDERYCADINYPVIKAIHVTDGMDALELTQRLRSFHRLEMHNPLVCLLDTKSGDKYGGSGAVFNWDIVDESNQDYPFFIAGGLHAGNVTGLVDKIRPLGIDVSSGVETGGHKDLGKIRNFVTAVRAASSSDSGDFPSKFLYKGSN